MDAEEKSFMSVRIEGEGSYWLDEESVRDADESGIAEERRGFRRRRTTFEKRYISTNAEARR